MVTLLGSLSARWLNTTVELNSEGEVSPVRVAVRARARRGRDQGCEDHHWTAGVRFDNLEVAPV